MINAGMSRRVAKSIWRMLGGNVSHVSGTGEERYSHPYFPKSITVSARRKDASKKLIAALRQITRKFDSHRNPYLIVQS